MAEEKPKQETNAQKLKRLREEAEIAKLEAEAAKRAKPPVKEKVKETLSTAKEKTVKGLGKTRDAVVTAAGYGKKDKVNPITGRLEAPPSVFEKGINSIADAAAAIARRVQISTAKNAEERVRLSMTPEQQAKKALEDAQRAKTYKQTIAEQAKEQRLNTPSPNLAVGPDKKIVITPFGGQAVVDKNTPRAPLFKPYEQRVEFYKKNLDVFLEKTSPMYGSNRETVPMGAILGAKEKMKRMGGTYARDFLINGLNKSGLFTSDEVPKVAQQLLRDPYVTTRLTDSMLFEGLEPPKTVQKGQVKLPKPADAGSKIQTIVDDFGEEVKVTPQGRVRTAAPAETPTLRERLARFQISEQRRVADEIEAARRAVAPYGDPNRDARLAGEAATNLAPYGGKGPSVATGPQAQAELRHKIETRARALAAQRAEAAAAREAARTRITEANNAAERAFLDRQEKARTDAQLSRISALWDLRTPAEQAQLFGAAAPNTSGVTRQDRLREIAKGNKSGAGLALETIYQQKTGKPNEKIWGKQADPLSRSIQGDPERLRPRVTLSGTMLPAIGGLAASIGTAAGQTAKGLEVMGMDYVEQKKAEMILENVPSEQWGDYEKDIVGRYYSNQRAKATGFDPTPRQSQSTRRGTDEPMQYNPMFAGGL